MISIPRDFARPWHCLCCDSATTSTERDREGAAVATYLITFVCYGSWLPGQSGAVDRKHNAFGSPLPAPDAVREQRAKTQIKQEPYVLDATRRSVVLASSVQVCSEKQWTLLAAHVRTRHVHAVVQADRSPEQVMSTLKAYASRAFNRMELDGADRRRWARHGSTRHLWTHSQVSAAIRYVVCEQGAAMAVFEAVAAR